MNHSGGIVGRDLDGGVFSRGRRPANQQRYLEAATLHLLGDMGHFLERGGDQAAEADDVGLLLDGGVEYLLGRNHDTQIDDFEIIAAEDDGDDALADVVDISLDGRHDHLAGLAGRLRQCLFLLQEWNKIGDRLFHHTGALDHLGQKHLPLSKKVTDEVHAFHERTLDDLDRTAEALPRFLGVLVDEFDDSAQEGVLETLLGRSLPPGELFFPGFFPASLEPLGGVDQPVGRVRTAVQQNVLHEF